MKHVTLALAIIFTSTFFAQRKCDTPPHHKKPNFTIEQQATLRIKKLTLALDLNDKQQSKILPLLKAQIQQHENFKKEREQKIASGVKPTDNEIFTKMNGALDNKLAYQKAVKKILNEEQFEKWQKMQRFHEMRKRHHKGPHGQRPHSRPAHHQRKQQL